LRRLAVAVLAALTLTGCVAKLAEGRVRSALVEAGLSEPNAACMADRMTDELSLGQLKKLEQLQGAKKSVWDYVSAVRRVGDAEVLAVTTSAAALCASGLAPEKK
jgi:hypothetical protein